MTRLPGLLPILTGFSLWTVGFVALYALQALGCQYGWGDIQLAGLDLHRTVLIATYAALLAGGGMLVLSSRRQPATVGSGRLIERVGFILNIAGLFSSALVFAAVLGTSTCI